MAVDLLMIGGGVLVVWIVYKITLGSNGRGKLPPSLPNLPIVGSLPFLSGLDQLHICLRDKAKKYGNVYGIYAGSKYNVVLVGHEAIREALVKKSSDFAGRAEFYADKHVLNLERRGISMKQYGETYKRNRQIIISILKDFGFGDNRIMEIKINAEISELINFLKTKKGESFHPEEILQLSSLNIIYNLMFSERFKAGDATANFLIKTLRTIADSYDPLLDIFPITSYFPKYRKMLAELAPVGQGELEFYRKKVEACKSQTEGEDNFVREYIRRAGSTFDEDDLLYTVRDIVIAGTETVSTALGWFIVRMGNDQQLQKKLQKDIDNVIGRGRLPNLDDRPALTLLEAAIIEILRLRPVVPLSVPRTTLKETEIAGFTIPSDTMVISNIWSANWDPEAWPEPEQFRPERFIDQDGKIDSKKREDVLSFSLGKRSCLGEIMARQELSLFAAGLLQNFTILPPEGEDHVVEKPQVVRVLFPAPYRCRFVPRAH